MTLLESDLLIEVPLPPSAGGWRHLLKWSLSVLKPPEFMQEQNKPEHEKTHSSEFLHLIRWHDFNFDCMNYYYFFLYKICCKLWFHKRIWWCHCCLQHLFIYSYKCSMSTAAFWHPCQTTTTHRLKIWFYRRDSKISHNLQNLDVSCSQTLQTRGDILSHGFIHKSPVLITADTFVFYFQLSPVQVSP